MQHETIRFELSLFKSGQPKDYSTIAGH